MKQIRLIFIIYTVLMLAVIGNFMVRGRRFDDTDRDISYYNDLLYKVCDDFSAGLPEEEIEAKYDCRIILAKQIQDPELAELYKKGALVLDLAPDGDYIGKVAWADSQDTHERAKRYFMVTSYSLWTGVLVCGYILILILYLNLIRPVDELTAFSGEIAKGNLDVPLPRHGHGLFGNFTEAFDIMRLTLKEAKKREVNSEIARKEIVTKLSHDIKTPAAVIKATCEVLELKLDRAANVCIPDTDVSDKPDTSDMGDILDKIRVISAKADTISSLMGNVMHSTINDLEEPDVNITEADSRIIEDYFGKLKDYGRIIPDNHITPCLLYMDPLRMEQVIDNIVGNSYKYAGTDIHVSFTDLNDMLMDDGTYGRFIKITVRDFGPGAGEEELPLLTEKYYRGSRAADLTDIRPEAAQGYGLGLYNVKWYMDKMGGGLDYYNDNGFVVELLLRKV